MPKLHTMRKLENPCVLSVRTEPRRDILLEALKEKLVLMQGISVHLRSQDTTNKIEELHYMIRNIGRWK